MALLGANHFLTHWLRSSSFSGRSKARTIVGGRLEGNVEPHARAERAVGDQKCNLESDDEFMKWMPCCTAREASEINWRFPVVI